MIKIGECFELGLVTYNRIEFVSACLSSIINYTKLPIRIIVCDNASTDGTREYLQTLYNNGLIQKLILNNVNNGIAESKNQIIKELEWKSNFFVLTDSDIVFPYTNPSWIEQMIEVVNRHPQVGVLNLNFLSVNVPKDTQWWFEKQKENHRQKKFDLLLLESGFWGSLIPKTTIDLVSEYNQKNYNDSAPFRCRSLYGETDEMFRNTLQKLNKWCGVAKNIYGINLGWDDNQKFNKYHLFKKIQRSKAEKLRQMEENAK